MIVELSGGFKAELRDSLTGGDRRMARKAITVTIDKDDNREVTAGLEDAVKYALLRRMILSWDIPGKDIPLHAEDPHSVLDGLPLEDLEALEAAVQDAYDRVMETGKHRKPDRDAEARKAVTQPRPRRGGSVIKGEVEPDGQPAG